MTKAKTAPPNGGLRAALQRKRRPSRRYRMQVSDPAPALAEMHAARQRLRMAELPGGDDDPGALADLNDDLTTKEAAVEACYEDVVLQCLAYDSFQQLIAEHPPTPEQKDESAQWNPDTFHPALIAACAGPELSAAEWTEILNSDAWSTAERNEIFNLALAVNVEAPTAARALR